jgi:hypothetical protein
VQRRRRGSSSRGQLLHATSKQPTAAPPSLEPAAEGPDPGHGRPCAPHLLLRAAPRRLLDTYARPSPSPRRRRSPRAPKQPSRRIRRVPTRTPRRAAGLLPHGHRVGPPPIGAAPRRPLAAVPCRAAIPQKRGRRATGPQSRGRRAASPPTCRWPPTTPADAPTASRSHRQHSHRIRPAPWRIRGPDDSNAAHAGELTHAGSAAAPAQIHRRMGKGAHRRPPHEPHGLPAARRAEASGERRWLGFQGDARVARAGMTPALLFSEQMGLVRYAG